MVKPLKKSLRERWDALMASEGAALGLADCHPFLENKLVNDIFYSGRFKGRPCIVKCSSRAPDSIVNEAMTARRLFAIAPEVFPEVLALFKTPDAKFALIVTRKISGPSFNTLRLRPEGISPQQADSFAADMLRIASALRQTGIVHRDINQDNLLLDADGHLKLIDFQFAVDRNDYHESAFMRRNWKYLYVVFAFSRPLGGAVWNDVRALRLRAQMMPQTAAVREAVASFAADESAARFSIPVPAAVRGKLRLYRASLRLQRLFRRASAKRSLIDKRIDLVNLLLSKKD